MRNKIADVLNKNEISEINSLRDALTKAIEKVEGLYEQINLIITNEDIIRCIVRITCNMLLFSLSYFIVIKN